MIEPDGRAVSYAELAREADRYGRGLQALGLSAGDTVATLLPNGVTALAMYFAAIETGLYIVPVNWHQVAAEVAYILGDSAAARVRRRRAVRRDRRGRRRTWPGSSTGSRWARCRASSRSAGSATTARTGARTPRTHGAPMLYTSGTSGRPKGVRRPLTGADPDDAAVTAAWFFHLFGLAPFDGHVHLCGSPLYHTRRAQFRHHLDPARPSRGADGGLGSGGGAAADRAAPGDAHARGADPVPADARRCPARSRAAVRHQLAARRDPQRGALPGRRSSGR